MVTGRESVFSVWFSVFTNSGMERGQRAIQNDEKTGRGAQGTGHPTERNMTMLEVRRQESEVSIQFSVFSVR